jgi:hypothetical protein
LAACFDRDNQAVAHFAQARSWAGVIPLPQQVQERVAFTLDAQQLDVDQVSLGQERFFGGGGTARPVLLWIRITGAVAMFLQEYYRTGFLKPSRRGCLGGCKIKGMDSILIDNLLAFVYLAAMPFLLILGYGLVLAVLLGPVMLIERLIRRLRR